MSDKQDIKPVLTPQGAIKVERLASFRMPRDLTLGGSNAARRGGFALNAPAKGRRTFTPNVNVQRIKPKEETNVKEEPARKDKNARGETARGRGDKGKERTIIQSTGVFAEGMGSNTYVSHRSKYGSGGGGGGGSKGGGGGGGSGGGGGGGGAEAVILKPKVDFKATLRADVKEEEARLKLLLRDDFIDDPEAEEPKVKPIQLPISAKAKGKPAVKKEEFKEEENKNGITVPAIRIKEEPADDVTDASVTSCDDKTDLGDDKEGSLDFLWKNEHEFMLLQLPDCLPGLRPSNEPGSPKHAQSTSAGTLSEKSPQQQCTLSTLSESQLGKIELLRSGAARLRIGELSFPLSLGTQASFRQDVVAVELDETSKSGNMLNLGSIENRMIARPDWDALLFRSTIGKHDSSVDSLLYQMPR